MPSGPLSVRTLQLLGRKSISPRTPTDNSKVEPISSISNIQTDITVATSSGDNTEDADDSGWAPISPIWKVENTDNWQTFPLEPAADVHSVRVVCYSNQMSAAFDRYLQEGGEEFGGIPRHLECVGYYTVKFE